MTRPRFILAETPGRAIFEWAFALLCLVYMGLSLWGIANADHLSQIAAPNGIRAASEAWIYQSATHYRIWACIGAIASFVSIVGLFSRGKGRALVPFGVGLLPVSKLVFLVLG